MNEKEIAICIDDLYAGRRPRYYVNYIPALRSERSGLKIMNVENKIINPLKGKSPYGWHFEQNVYTKDSIIRALKSSEGSGNIPKVITNIYFTCEDGNENCIERFDEFEDAIDFAEKNKKVKEIFLFVNGELYSGVKLENFICPPTS